MPTLDSLSTGCVIMSRRKKALSQFTLMAVFAIVCKTHAIQHPQCLHPRKEFTFVPRNKHNRVPVTLNQSECLSRFGWGQPSKDIRLGQNLEDAVIYNRFFSGGPLQSLATEGGGTFLEMGALDGMTFSNTFIFEYCLQWDGVLIEAQPENAKLLMKNRPCAHNFAEGVCAEPGTIRMSLGQGTAYDLSVNDKQDSKFITVPCRPLSAILDEADVTHINFFSLDVEGAELKVLETIDFEKVEIDILMFETTMLKQTRHNLQDTEIEAKSRAIHDLLRTKSRLKKVPSRFHCNKTHPEQSLCRRGTHGFKSMFLGIGGSELWVSPRVYDYDTKPWEF